MRPETGGRRSFRDVEEVHRAVDEAIREEPAVGTDPTVGATVAGRQLRPGDGPDHLPRLRVPGQDPIVGGDDDAIAGERRRSDHSCPAERGNVGGPAVIEPPGLNVEDGEIAEIFLVEQAIDQEGIAAVWAHQRHVPRRAVRLPELARRERSQRSPRARINEQEVTTGTWADEEVAGLRDVVVGRVAGGELARLPVHAHAVDAHDAVVRHRRDALPVRRDLHVLRSVPDRHREGPDHRRRPEQRREQRPRGLRRVVKIERLAGEQHRAVDPRLRNRLGAELTAKRHLRLVLRVRAGDERKRARDDGEDEQRHGAGEESLEASVLAPLAGDLKLVRGGTDIDELALEFCEGDCRLAREQLELREIAAAQQVARLAAGVLPLPGRRSQTSMQPHLLAAAVDPAPEPAPFAHERLVRHLDRRRSAARVAVKREQAPSAELLDRLLERVLVDLHRGELCPFDAPARVLRALAQGDESEEQLPRRLLRLLPEAAVDLLRPAGQRARDAADRAVRIRRQRAALASLVQLRQGVLEERQGAGLVSDVRDELGEQARLEARAHPLRRTGDRPLELLCLEWDERFDVVAQQFREAAVEQRPVVEVGPQRDDDAEARVRVADRTLEERKELRATRLVLDEGEHLLELIDDQHELRFVVDEEALDGPQQAAIVLLELLEQPRRRTVRRTQERRLELLERIRAREQLHDVPAFRARQRTLPEPRDEPGAHHRRLAAAARADDREKTRLAETLDQMLGQGFPAEKVLGVALAEGPKSLVRVARLERARCCRIERSAKGEIARDVLALRPDRDDLHRFLESLESHRAPLDVLQALDLPCEMRHTRAHEHFARAGERAEPGREIERSAAVAAVDRHRFASVEPDPDSEGQARIGDRLRNEALLQRRRRAQRLPRRIKYGQRLVAAQLDERTAVRLDRLARELREPRRQPRSRFVAALLGEPRIAADICDQERLDPRFDGRHRWIVRFGAG